MRRSMRSIGIAVVFIVLGWILLSLGNRSSGANQLEREARAAQGDYLALQSGKILVSPRLLLDKILGRASPERYSGLLNQSLSNMVAIGYLTNRTFVFANGTNSLNTFATSIVHRIDFKRDGWSSCKFLWPTSVVVIARPDSMGIWERCVMECDEKAAQLLTSPVEENAGQAAPIRP